MIYRTVYVSCSEYSVSDAEISEILNISRRNNTRDGLTGLLVYHERRFFQVIEGPLEPLEACYRRIEADKRHFRVRPIARGTSADRAFPSWRMGYSTPDDLTPDRRSSVLELTRLAVQDSVETGNNARVQMLLKNFLLGSGIQAAAE